MKTSLRNKMAGATAGGTMVMATVLIQWHEGVKYTPYQDSGGVLTVCYGHTGNVISDKSYTQKECDSLLDSDLKTAMAMVDTKVTVPLTQSQKAALVSFAYNVGGGAFARSTLLKKLNTGDIAGACDEMRRWVYVDGRVWQGLVSRRNVERELCLQGQP